jgi:hypothetical protein
MKRRATFARRKALAGGAWVRHLRGVTLYYAAMVLLSIGAFIHSKSPAPEMRPASEAASTFWLWLSRAAFVTWVALIVWGFRELHWSQPLAALMVSLVSNAVIAMRGPRDAWPMLSMVFSLLGLAAAAIIFLEGLGPQG